MKLIVVGAGPAGVTCAYHLARQDYPAAMDHFEQALTIEPGHAGAAANIRLALAAVGDR